MCRAWSMCVPPWERGFSSPLRTSEGSGCSQTEACKFTMSPGMIDRGHPVTPRHSKIASRIQEAGFSISHDGYTPCHSGTICVMRWGNDRNVYVSLSRHGSPYARLVMASTGEVTYTWREMVGIEVVL